MSEYTDPPGMPADERMTPAEFKVVREFLGLSGDWLAAYLNVSPRIVRYWEQGKYRIPDGVRLAVEELEQRTATVVSGMVDMIMGVPDPVVVTYRTDADYHAAHPDNGFPASWHRAVVARVAQEVPALSIVFADDAATTPVPAGSRKDRR